MDSLPMVLFFRGNGFHISCHFLPLRLPPQHHPLSGLPRSDEVRSADRVPNQVQRNQGVRRGHLMRPTAAAADKS
jgi:hypothetical protein